MKKPIMSFLMVGLFLLVIVVIMMLKVQKNAPQADFTKVFLKADQEIKAAYPNVYSLLAAKDDKLVYENYYHGMDKAVSNNVMSVTKSVISALIGIVIEEGKIRGIDEKLVEIFPEYYASGLQPLADTIELKHVISMTDGFAINNPQNAYDVVSSENWIKAHLELPLYAKPGTEFYYSNQTTHLLSGVITKTTGMKALNYANLKIFQPLGMDSDKQWGMDPQGNNIGGIELHLTPREMVNFGLMYLHNGQWKGQQIIPENWIKLSTQKQSAGQFFGYGSYGYGWWMLDNDPRYTDQSIYYAAGYGGQYIFVMPKQQMVVVMTAELPTGNYPDPIKVFTDYIMPAVNPHS
ncbi:class C beta-lactamase-related serine hydrolase [Paenibacillus psychroresistens]|uniref:Class C beta-lactamase-related serine hydrolase n=1 Tax=Paenibacillus psychroresistens TaxID=1778678 RepID=A0A6B8RIZ0_9BACL|nr:serine hydrolase [Paenibacillus psychroresistens]QGQ95513.1 class C beta-lactamase-related serine hydrolase [Paenibacillus psychroresistens]